MTDPSSLESADDLRRSFLDDLLRSLGEGTRGLVGRIEEVGRDAAAERQQRRLGWCWAVANELAGEGASPDRREASGTAWLAACLDPRLAESVGAWPRIRPEAADWRVAYALVLFTRVALERAGGRRASRRALGEGCSWHVTGTEGPVPDDLRRELERLFPDRSVLVSDDDGWRLELPLEWRLENSGGAR